MDALLLIDTDDASYPSDDAMETLGDIVTRTRAVGGVLIFASTKEGLADTPDEELSIFVPDEEDLVLRSNGPDVFEGVDDLAAGLHDMAVDRIIIAGADDTAEAPSASATAEAPSASATADALANADTDADADAPADADADADADAPGAVYASAMAALVCNFDVIVLSDSTTDPRGELVTWTDAAESAGAMIKKTADTWLRM
ncbi:hypothetical protein [Brevibacterium sp. FAM 24630]|uniref:hypothetical protein n=1 Tax=Brevibacterium sp. FAM 24630 TaxID=3415680 RepID=UPI003C7C034A